MKAPVFYMAGQNDALMFAKEALMGQDLIFSNVLNSNVTHLLFGAPAFEKDGTLKGGGKIESILSQCSPGITIIGGNLQHPALKNYRTIDLLQDPYYLTENADITAYCALKVAERHMPAIWKDCPVLVIGGGRIGTCLAKLLKAMRARVTVAVRNIAQRAIWETLDYDSADSTNLGYSLARYRVIFNTVPFMVLPEDVLCHLRNDCLKIDLASIKGIAGDDVIWARGLPSKEAPESSGRLIARTILRRYQEGEW